MTYWLLRSCCIKYLVRMALYSVEVLARWLPKEAGKLNRCLPVMCVRVRACVYSRLEVLCAVKYVLGKATRRI